MSEYKTTLKHLKSIEHTVTALIETPSDNILRSIPAIGHYYSVARPLTIQTEFPVLSGNMPGVIPAL